MRRRRPWAHVVPVHLIHLRPPIPVYLFVITAADDNVEEDFMNPTLMAPLAIRLKYTPAEVRIFLH